ncbi:MAG: hypothetical protein ACRDLV_03650 [Solirubrobacteraceae bacterium]
MSATGRTARRRRAGGAWARLGTDGLELSAAGEDRAELAAEARAGLWELAAEFDSQGPGGYGWAPDPYPDGGLI